jgi:hypothetical protein
MSTNNATVAQETTKTVKVLNGEQIQQINDCFRTLHSICFDAGKGENLPTDYSTLTFDQIGAVCVRAINALATVQKRAKDAKDQSVRNALSKVLETYMATARQEKSEYDALSSSLKARLGAFDATAKIPVNDLHGILETSNPSVMVKRLHDLGFKIDGRSIAKQKNVTHIAIPLPV